MAGAGTGTPATAASAATITKAQIYREITVRLAGFNVKLTKFDEEISNALQSLSLRRDYLTKQETLTATVAGTATGSPPGNMKAPIALWRTGGNELTAITVAEYMTWIEDQATIIQGEPNNYALDNDTLFYYPTPDAVYTFNILYTRIHPRDLTAIEFGSEFRTAIYSGVLKELWAGQLAHLPMAVNEINKHIQIYEFAILNLPEKAQRTLAVKYHDF